MNSLHAVHVRENSSCKPLFESSHVLYYPWKQSDLFLWWYNIVSSGCSFYKKCFDIIFDANCSHLFYLPMSACSVLALPSKNYKKISIRAQWWKISQWLYLFPAITNITQYKYFVFVPVFVLFGSGSIVKSETDSDPTFIFTWSEIK